MATVTVISADEHTVDARTEGGRVLVDPAALTAATGWTLKPEGLCHDDVCVPVRNRAAMVVDGLVDLAAAADALHRPVVVDDRDDTAYVAIALAAEQRRRALRDLEAPDLTLPDLDGRLHSLREWHGRKRLLQAFSSW